MTTDADLAAENERLRALIGSPSIEEFLKSVQLEAVHQIERWGPAHDRAKEPADWFWLVGYLAGKALHAHIAGDVDKARHHTISSAAALLQWHRHITDGSGSAVSDVEAILTEAFGPGILDDG